MVNCIKISGFGFVKLSDIDKFFSKRKFDFDEEDEIKWKFKKLFVLLIEVDDIFYVD